MRYLECPRCHAEFRAGLIYEAFATCPRWTSLWASFLERLAASVAGCCVAVPRTRRPTGRRSPGHSVGTDG
jgi:hypothetical protein